METMKPSKTFKNLSGCKKRKVHVMIRSNHRVLPSYWEGGSRTLTYRVAGNSLVPVQSVSNPFAGEKPIEIALEPGMVLVELGHFCGNEAIPALIASSMDDLKGLVE